MPRGAGVPAAKIVQHLPHFDMLHKASRDDDIMRRSENFINILYETCRAIFIITL